MKLDFYIASAKRTAVGTFLGSLKKFGPVELGVIAAEAAIKESGMSTDQFVHSIFGNVCSASSSDAPYLARHIALRAGLPKSVGSLTVNRLCGSGFEAISQAGQWVEDGPCLVGGAESMSLTPLMMRDAREGFKFMRPPETVDSLWEALNDKYANMPMAQTAENLAKEFSISREDCDHWAYLSQSRAAKATEQGLFKKEIVPVEVPKLGVFDKDEHIRPNTTKEKLASLKAVFGGVTTAGNASGMNDAGAALVVAKKEHLKEKPMAKAVGVQVVGCDPERMGIGPVQAIQKLLGELNWKMSEVDYLEINEAFAAQILAVKKSLEVSEDQLNPHGSGISLGHPLGATGARISTHCCQLIADGAAKKAIGAACIGGGQGIAIAFEAVSV